jgi:two-component system KDP operon response regulator KdpE
VTRVLAVEDDPGILRGLAVNLRARGFEVDLASTGEAALELAAQHPPNATILDLGLPGMSGFDVISAIRAWSESPIIVLSAFGDQPNKVRALELGADDYVTKPFGMEELFARLRAVLRRSRSSAGERVVVTPDFTLDFGAKTVATAAGEVRLTRIEWRIVEVLVTHAGALVTGDQLVRAVWGPMHNDRDNKLRVHLARIRQKLEPEPPRPRYFVTEVGVGYRFVSSRQ